MVNPIYIIVITLGAAFIIGLFRKTGPGIHVTLALIATAAITAVSAQWTIGILAGNVEEINIFTAGMNPPLSINLYMGKIEAVLTLIVNAAVFLSTMYIGREYRKSSVFTFMLLLVFAMGLNGIILTRDLFNLFVFIEIVSIASAGLIVLNSDIKQLGAGFKYVIAGALASGFMLIGIIFTYYRTGSLNIDVISGMFSFELVKACYIGMFLLFIGIVIELKPFPANGWGLDAYEASASPVGAMLAGGTATAMFFAYTKINQLSGGTFLNASLYIGALTFAGMNILALKQTNAKRLLGYSSISQIGMVVMVYAMVNLFDIENGMMIVLALLVTHAIAKAVLFWLSGIIGKAGTDEWGIIRKRNILIAVFAIAVGALLALPPFPSFYAKWELVMKLAASGHYGWIFILLGGALIEAVYLMRWFGNAVKNDYSEDDKLDFRFGTAVPVLAGAAALLALGYFSADYSSFGNTVNWILPAAVVVLMLLDFLPAIVKNILLIAAVAYYGYPLLMEIGGYRSIFAGIFIIGALVTLLPGFMKKDRRMGFYPSVSMMFAGLVGIIEAADTLSFFFFWELMTLGSYFLILRGKNSKPHALSYMLFSLGGAYLIMSGFALSYAQTGASSIALSILPKAASGALPGITMLLLSVGFMTKMASAGLHIWLPGAHAEAETDVSPMVSGILLKAGVFGLLMTFIAFGEQAIGRVNIPYVLSWVGVITALVANYMAALQEDAKRMLAYSSIGQMGYVLFGLALMSHLGWLSALSLSLVHFIYKVVLFLAIGGVVYRVKTRNMYQMGGLITRMPLSFFNVLVCIIALSGIPPLAGFGGRWLTYNAVIEKGWLLQGVVAGIAGLVAFLYLFRLIATIFLGQLKDEHRKVKEAPFFLVLPQLILILAVIYLSFFPGSFLKPIGEILMDFHTEGALTWNGSLAISDYGYWNGQMVMWVFIGLFVVFFVILFLTNRHNQQIKQFNIVYAAERPARPETTHFAYNMFAHYRKAVGFLEYPLTTKFWNSISELLHAVSGFFRRIYTGKGQTYLLQMLLFVVICYLLDNGGF